MATRTGMAVKHGDVVYKFETEEDAINFESCVNGGGGPASCAEQFNCISKETVTPVKSPGKGR